MRFLTYILLLGSICLAVFALGVVLTSDGEQAILAPQTQSAPPIDVGKTGQAATASLQQSGPSTSPERASGGPGREDALRIDLAQVRPDGNAVFAGKSEPGSEVTVFEGGVVLGNTVADEAGEWVVVAEKALGPGEHLVSIGAMDEEGNAEISDIALAIKVFESGEEKPLVALLPGTEDEIPQLLQTPDDFEISGEVVSRARNRPALAPRALFWREDGSLVISGVARGGERIEIIASSGATSRTFGRARVEGDGSWRVTGRVDINDPSRDMRFALRDSSGATTAGYVLRVTTRDLARGYDGARLVVVQRGDALWRIAYRTYGQGVRYVDIVRRNAASIKDPDLIFPNQIFAIP